MAGGPASGGAVAAAAAAVITELHSKNSRPRQIWNHPVSGLLEFIAQVFNLFGRDNLGVAGTWQENVLSDSFGRLLEVQPRQQAELAVRFTF